MYNIWTQFLPQEFIVSGLMVFTVFFFFYNNNIFNSVILLEFNDVLSTEVFFHTIDNYSHSLPHTRSLEGSYESLI